MNLRAILLILPTIQIRWNLKVYLFCFKISDQLMIERVPLFSYLWNSNAAVLLDTKCSLVQIPRFSGPNRLVVSSLLPDQNSDPSGEAYECNNYCVHLKTCRTSEEMANAPNSEKIQRLRYVLLLLENKDQFKLKAVSRGIGVRQLRNAHFNVFSPDLAPYAVRTPKGIIGLSIEPIITASLLYNFTYKFHIAKPKFIKHPNGSWGGLLGDLIQGRIDLVISALASNYERFSAVDYGAIGFQNDLTFLTSEASLNLDEAAFISPFDGLVWTLFLLLVALLIFTFYIHYAYNGLNQPLSCSLITILSPIVSQSNSSLPVTLRALLGLWMLGSLLIQIFHSSNLHSFITHPAVEGVPGDFQELAARHEYSIEMTHVPSSTFNKFFEASAIPAVVSIRQKYFLNTDHVQCVTRAATMEKFACIGLSGLMYPLINSRLMLRRGFKPVVVCQKPVTRLFLHSVTQKDSKYRDDVNFITSWSRDTGLVTAWLGDVLEYFDAQSAVWLRSEEGADLRVKLEAIDLKKSSSPVQAFQVRHLAMGFGLLITGVVGAIVVFVVEKLKWRANHKVVEFTK